jgi:biopolymer transport protein ExbB
MKFGLLDIWNQMGPPAKAVVIILVIMSMYALAISVERLFVFRRGRHQSMSYIGALQPLVAAPARMTEAVGLDLQWKQSPVARVIGAGVSEFARGQKKLGPRADPFALETMVEGVRRSMERSKERELANLRRGLAFLATVSSSAPFVGLFGTVFGIITAFQNMAAGEGSGGLSTVSAGISEALMTTAVGLAVAIISVWFYNFFITKVDAILVDIEETTGEVLDSMMSAGELATPGGASGSSRVPRA